MKKQEFTIGAHLNSLQGNKVTLGDLKEYIQFLESIGTNDDDTLEEVVISYYAGYQGYPEMSEFGYFRLPSKAKD